MLAYMHALSRAAYAELCRYCETACRNDPPRSSLNQSIQRQVAYTENDHAVEVILCLRLPLSDSVWPHLGGSACPSIHGGAERLRFYPCTRCDGCQSATAI